jgi:hypothetical protein
LIPDEGKMMIKITIRAAFEEFFDTAEHYLYLYRDGTTVFYVGKSFSPLDRLMEHLALYGRSLGSRLGDVINDNFPASLDWTMEMFTLQDCESIVKAHQFSSYPFYQRCLMQQSPIERDMAIKIAEESLIDHYKPCLNVLARRYRNPLPAKYIKQKIANDGVILE